MAVVVWQCGSVVVWSKEDTRHMWTCKKTTAGQKGGWQEQIQVDWKVYLARHKGLEQQQSQDRGNIHKEEPTFEMINQEKEKEE